MFADDTQIASASNDIKILAGMLNTDLVNISDWMAANKLSLNASKTESMLFGSHKKFQLNRNCSAVGSKTIAHYEHLYKKII